MAGKPKAPVRAQALDGLRPTDFVDRGNWPHGVPTEPEALRKRGYTDEQRNNLFFAVMALRQLVIDYEKYLQGKRVTQAAVAKKLVMSTSQLSALRTGKNFPSFQTYVTLRTFIPSKERMERGDFGE